MQSGSQLHQMLLANDHNRSCVGAMKRSKVRASLTMGATWLAASTSIRISSSVKVRASLVWTINTPCRTPRSTMGTPRKEWIVSSSSSLNSLNRGWFITSATATGRTVSATRPVRPSFSGMRSLPMQRG